jgi:murein DD-endopeptidase MepM/ murein hydrolase activator NlpD
VQHRARTPVRGRHRVARPPRGGQGRYAVVTAALFAGVGIAGFATAAAGSAGSVTHLPAAAGLSTDSSAPAAAPDATAGPGALAAPSGPAAPTGAPTGPDAPGSRAPAGPDAPASRAPGGSDAPASRAPGGSDAGLLAEGGPGANPPTLAWVRSQRKPRPVVAAAAQWVNPLPEGQVTSCFGMRWGRLHAGVDLAAAQGTPIHAAGAGVVVAAGPADGYGNAVLIDHGDGYLTHYGHMSVVRVQAGDRVAAGQQIGDEGSTGHSTGPHLHFEVHAGHYQNPIEPTLWMHRHGVDIPGCVPLG